MRKLKILYGAAIVAISATCLFGPRCSAEDWWQFRGPASGHSTAVGLPLEWDNFFDAPIWQTFIPGKGWSSPVVVGDRIWLTSAEQVALEDSAAGGKLADLPYPSGVRSAVMFIDSAAGGKLADLPFGSFELVTDASVKLFALEIDAQSGELLRRIDLFERQDPKPIHTTNSYASPTPATDGQRLYCHFGSLGTACIEISTGDVLWKRELEVDDLTGPAVSPVL